MQSSVKLVGFFQATCLSLLFGVKRQCRFGSLHFGFNVLQVNGAANEEGSKKGDHQRNGCLLSGYWMETGMREGFPTRFISPMLMKKVGGFLNCVAGNIWGSIHIELAWRWVLTVVHSSAVQDYVISVQVLLFNWQGVLLLLVLWRRVFPVYAFCFPILFWVPFEVVFLAWLLSCPVRLHFCWWLDLQMFWCSLRILEVSSRYGGLYHLSWLHL